MSLLNKSMKSLSICVLLFSVKIFAGDIPIDNVTINDQGDKVDGPTYKYAIDKMTVNWDENDQITVDIYTNFGSQNNRNYYYGKRIIYGDLLLGTTSDTDDYNYAFSLGDLTSNFSHAEYYGDNKITGHERYYTHNDGDNSTYSSGGLYEISNTLSVNEYHNGTRWGNRNTKTGKILADIEDIDDKAASGTWGVNNSRRGFDILSFSFNVANIEAFQNAKQLSLSWAMSCFNDAVTGTISKATSNIKVPLPTTSILFLLALTLMLVKQRKTLKHNTFSA